MRISDWSSDVCSSDLKGIELVEPQLVGTAHHVQSRQRHRGDHRALAPADRAIATARVDDTVRQLQLQFDCAAMATGPVARRYRHARHLMDPMRHFRLLLPSGGRLYDPRPTTPPVPSLSRNMKIGRASCRERVCQYV